MGRPMCLACQDKAELDTKVTSQIRWSLKAVVKECMLIIWSITERHEEDETVVHVSKRNQGPKYC